MEEISKKHLDFIQKLKTSEYDSHIYTDKLRRIAFAYDASCYQLIPQVIVVVSNHKQVRRVLSLANQLQIAITFRAAGTSLSGQALSDSVLLVIDNKWDKYNILENAVKIRMDPGLIAGNANKYLQVYGKKIGPDPSSIASAKIGGIVANNASGMCCGIAHNSYNTLYGMKLVFANGDELDTENEESIRHFKARNPKLIAEIIKLSQKVKQDTELSHLISHKYRLKNTTGYGINALLDFTDPIDIIMHLIVGSEGTLGFISSVSLYTRDLHVNKATGLYIFDNIELACNATANLSNIGVNAVELLDRSSLKSLQGNSCIPLFIEKLNASSVALLIELSDTSCQLLHHKISLCENILQNITHPQSLKFTTNSLQMEQLWHLRHGLFPRAASLRKNGTTILIEDIAFPLEYLATGTIELREILNKHGYNDAIIFGHILSGNLHFIFGQDFNNKKEIERYDELMHSITNLVAIKYKGSLKAEHGTGRNMASFVELEWGKVAYEIMQTIKSLFDPRGILNPDVILSKNSNIHLENLKSTPQINSIIDKCTECGFCESVCPSKNLSLTPRQRIVVKRYLAQVNNLELSQEVLKDYEYLGVKTCATTGMCELKCPVGINTGEYMLGLTLHSKIQTKLANYSVNNFGRMSYLIKNILRLSNLSATIIGKKRLYKISQYVNKKTNYQLPVYLPVLPNIMNKIKLDTLQLDNSNHKKIVYFPSCVNRVLGNENHSLINTARHLFNHFGYSIIMPDISSIGKELCCGQVFSSTNNGVLANIKFAELLEQLNKLSKNGEYAIYFDTTPCVLQMHNYKSKYPHLKIYDIVEFIHDIIMPDISNHEFTKIKTPVALHITCSAKRLGLGHKILSIANLCAENVVVPNGIECCGFAGSKGFFTPEINKSALDELATQVMDCTHGYSTSTTCEIGRANAY